MNYNRGDIDDSTADGSGRRITVNGWGTNDGDPTVEGEWFEEGHEGLQVYDTINNNKFVYIREEWR